MITDALADEGIEFVLKPFHDTAYDGLFEATKGFALLLVDETEEHRARAIVDELRLTINQAPGFEASEDVDFGDTDPEKDDPGGQNGDSGTS